MSDDPSVRKSLRGFGKTRWKEEWTTTESSRARRLSEIQAFMKSSLSTATLRS